MSTGPVEITLPAVENGSDVRGIGQRRRQIAIARNLDPLKTEPRRHAAQFD